MTSVIADTNVFLRYLTNDVPKQADDVERRFYQAKSHRLQISVLHVTIVEVMFHLEHWYHLARKEACQKLLLLYSQSWIDIEQKPAILLALTMYATTGIDFVDVLTWTVAQTKQANVLSFDKDYDKLTPKLRVEP